MKNLLWICMAVIALTACKKDNVDGDDQENEARDQENYWAYAEFSDGVVWNSLGGSHHVNAKPSLAGNVLTITAERNKRKITLQLHGFSKTQDVAFGTYLIGIDAEVLESGAKKAVLSIEDNGTVYNATGGGAVINSFLEDGTKQGVTVTSIVADARSADGKTLNLTDVDGLFGFGNYVTVRVNRN